MDENQLTQTLNKLINTWENEVSEFKEVTNSFETDKIGRYFSALANEANLRGLVQAWLVFGVRNSDRQVVGTDYREDSERLQGLKQQIAADTEPGIHFKELYVLQHAQGRVVMMQIPAAPCGIPIAWKGHYYARAGASLVGLGLDKQDEIRQQTTATDWSAQIVTAAMLDDLDVVAVQKARESFSLKYANRIPKEEIDAWPLATFLDRAKVTRNSQITRTTLLLLGKPEAAHLLNPHPAQITWKLEGEARAYEHFGVPFLLNSSSLYENIRNIQVRILPKDKLLAVEVSKYDMRIVLEALHNCIAHQDYTRNARIIVTEFDDRLVFENEGTFFEGKPDDYVAGTITPRRYRNPFLAQAMAELNMIDIMGYGIHSIHVSQAKRYFPMPDYDLQETGAVKLTIHGQVVDLAYSRMLIQKTDLSLDEILFLDRVQKKLLLTDDMIKRLRRSKLIGGRKPNFYVSAKVAKATSAKSKYIKNKAFDDEHYEEMIIKFLKKFKKASRKDIDELLWSKLSDGLDRKQKKYKIGNLLSELRGRGRVYNAGTRSAPDWRLQE